MRQRRIGRTGIDDDDFGAGVEAGEAGADAVLLVLADDGGGKRQFFGHGRQPGLRDVPKKPFRGVLSKRHPAGMTGAARKAKSGVIFAEHRRPARGNPRYGSGGRDASLREGLQAATRRGEHVRTQSLYPASRTGRSKTAAGGAFARRPALRQRDRRGDGRGQTDRRRCRGGLRPATAPAAIFLRPQSRRNRRLPQPSRRVAADCRARISITRWFSRTTPKSTRRLSPEPANSRAGRGRNGIMCWRPRRKPGSPAPTLRNGTASP